MNVYELQARKFCRDNSVMITRVFTGHKKYFNTDTQPRDTYSVTIRRGKAAMTTNFGQSIANEGKKPSKYDILACLTKYDPGSFEEFCSDFGYDSDSRKAYEVYEAVCKEWEGVEKVFIGILEQLQEIN